MDEALFRIVIALLFIFIIPLATLVKHIWQSNVVGRFFARVVLRKPYVMPNLVQTQCNIEGVLDSLNVKYTKTNSEETSFVDYIFSFQDGHFILVLYEDDERMMRLMYPAFYVCKVDNIDMVRSVCNDFNNNYNHYLGLTAFYDYLENTKELRMHISCAIPRLSNVCELADILTEMMEKCFTGARELSQNVTNYLSENRRYNCTDIEYLRVRDNELRSIVNECEAKHDGTSLIPEGHVGLTNAKPITLGAWLDAMDYLIGCDIKQLRLFSPQGVAFSTDDLKTIEHYNLKDAVRLTRDALNVVTGCEDTTLEVLFEPFSSKESTGESSNLHTLRLFFHSENVAKEGDVLYVRMTHLIPQCGTLDPQPESHFDKNEHPISGSQLLAVELQPEQKTQARLHFLLQDAEDKVNEGRNNELSPEQRLMLRFEKYDQALLTYLGHRYLREGCYLDAVFYLTQMWNTLNARLDSMSKQERNVIFDVTEWLGTALYKLGLYKRAYYYIDQLNAQNSPDHAKLFLNCLVAMKDWRVIPTIEEKMQSIEAEMERARSNEEEIDSTVLDYYKFLQRRYVYYLIEVRQLSKAQKLCEEMLAKNSNDDFALSELAHIAKLLKKQPSEGDAPSSASD